MKIPKKSIFILVLMSFAFISCELMIAFGTVKIEDVIIRNSDTIEIYFSSSPSDLYSDDIKITVNGKYYSVLSVSYNSYYNSKMYKVKLRNYIPYGAKVEVSGSGNISGKIILYYYY